MKIDAIGLPVDRLQLRPDSLRQSERASFARFTPQPVTPVAAKPEEVKPATPSNLYGLAGAAASQAVVTATVKGGARSTPTPASLIDQLRRQRLSLGRMLTDVNRRLAEPYEVSAN